MNSVVKKRSVNLAALQMAVCPYNENHLVKKSKMFQHLTNCEKSLNADQLKQWKTCEFNASHRMRVEEYETHLMTCSSNKTYLRECFDAIPFNESKISEEKATSSAMKTDVFDPDIQIKEEVKVEESDEKVMAKAAAKRESDEWQTSNQPFFNPFDIPYTTAEELIENNLHLDSFAVSKLCSSERKKLKSLMIINDKRQQRRAATKGNLHFDPIQRPSLAKMSDFCYELRFNSLPQSMANFSFEDFHDINLEDIRRNLFKSQTKKTVIEVKTDFMSENIDNVIGKAMRSQAMMTTDEYFEYEFISEKVFRRPKTTPFKLRRPKIGDFSGVKDAPKD